MKKKSQIIFGIVLAAAIIFVLIYTLSRGDEQSTKNPFNYSEGLILMMNSQTGEYACFGCNDVMCKDPAPIMEAVVENDNIYCDDKFNVVRNGETNIKVKSNFGNKIVYETTENATVSDFKKDCTIRGGTFNECGSPCPPKSEFCVMMCAFTCDNITQT